MLCCAALCYGLCCTVVYSRVKRLGHTCIVYGTAMILTPTKQRSWAFILFPFQFDCNENSNRSCVPCTHSFNLWFRCECVGWIFEHVINEWDHTNREIPIFLKIVHHIEYTISNCDRCLNEYLFLSHSKNLFEESGILIVPSEKENEATNHNRQHHNRNVSMDVILLLNCVRCEIDEKRFKSIWNHQLNVKPSTNCCFGKLYEWRQFL